ncbi:hypothetical protein Fot_06054 [Forsythia ovata]|uniref:Uncharacterized protein n=1 Tax=Forsythia ovata TaxID=205694 RepID=A0ABD1WRV2_9LAMI
MKEKKANHDQKKALSELSLNGGDKDQPSASVPSYPKQATLVPVMFSRGLLIMVQKQEAGAKQAEKKRLEARKEKRSTSSSPKEVEPRASLRPQPEGEDDEVCHR